MTNTVKTKRTRQIAKKPSDPKLGTMASSDAGNQVTPAPVSAPAPALAAEPKAKPDTKSARVVALLQRKEGATQEEMVAATGWLPHTTRAAMTGLKRKGHTIDSIKADGVRRYFAKASGTEVQ